MIDNLDKIIYYIDKFNDKELKTKVRNILVSHEELLRFAPASTKHHHNYEGGLLEHILECCQLADSLMSTLPYKFDTDNVLAACILHDIGKIYEYNINDRFGFITEDIYFKDKWISHTLYAFNLCMNNGLTKVAKLIAGHHGKKEWGSLLDIENVKNNKNVMLVHYVDMLSAKFGKSMEV